MTSLSCKKFKIILPKIRLNSHITFRSTVRLSWSSNTLCFKSVILAWLNYRYHNSRKIPGLSRTSVAFQGLSRPGILFFKSKDFPGFSRTVGTLIDAWARTTMNVFGQGRMQHKRPWGIKTDRTSHHTEVTFSLFHLTLWSCTPQTCALYEQLVAQWIVWNGQSFRTVCLARIHGSFQLTF